MPGPGSDAQIKLPRSDRRSEHVVRLSSVDATGEPAGKGRAMTLTDFKMGFRRGPHGGEMPSHTDAPTAPVTPDPKSK